MVHEVKEVIALHQVNEVMHQVTHEVIHRVLYGHVAKLQSCKAKEALLESD
jgi:hypothetical protein